MNLDLIELANEPEPDGPLVLKRYPVYVPDTDYPVMFMDSLTVRVWVEFNEDWELEMLSTLPDVSHPVRFYIEDCGVDDLLGYVWRSDVAFFGRMDRGLEMGLCPRQPFYAELYVHYYVSHTAEGDDYDCDTDLTVIEITPLPDLEIAKLIGDCIQQ